MRNTACLHTNQNPSRLELANGKPYNSPFGRQIALQWADPGLSAQYRDTFPSQHHDGNTREQEWQIASGRGLFPETVGCILCPAEAQRTAADLDSIRRTRTRLSR